MRYRFLTVITVIMLALAGMAQSALADHEDDEIEDELGMGFYEDHPSNWLDVKGCAEGYSTDTTHNEEGDEGHPAFHGYYENGAENVCLFIPEDYVLLVFGGLGQHGDEDDDLMPVALGCNADDDGWIVMEHVHGEVLIVHDEWAMETWIRVHGEESGDADHFHFVPAYGLDDLEGPGYTDTATCTLDADGDESDEDDDEEEHDHQ